MTFIPRVTHVASHLTGTARTYAAVKAVVLAAGRYSVFEVQDDPELFNALDHDPELVTWTTHPWVYVRVRGC